MRRNGPTEESFLKDVATHGTEILLDQGLHRHVRFRRPGTYCMGFDLVTWPGYLAYSGDMGCYVFSRIPDMFEFFRTRPSAQESGTRLHINLSYWAEKCEALDRCDKIKEYSADTFREAILERLDDAEASASVREEVRSRVLACAHDGEYAAHQAARDFEHEGFEFTDFWEVDCTEYTRRYIWCCYALAWGIGQYDAARSVSDRTAV